MRRLAILLAALAAVLALAPAGRAFNPQIAGLQIALRERGLYRGAIDGIQGRKTRKAVLVFQRRHGLVVDGLAGPRTRTALGRQGRPLFGVRVLRRGLTGYDVGVLQFLLARRGLRPGALDGRFGARTERAVRRFQRRAHLVPDGAVGRRTARRLCALRTCAWRAAPHRRARRVHRIRPGETLTAISQRYRVGVKAIARANRLDPQRIILAGAHLRIPAAQAAMGQPFAVRSAIDYWSRQYGVDPGLVRALASNSLISTAGAPGVMQVTPATWDYVETVLVGRRIPRTLNGNVRVGVAFLHQLLHEFGGDVPLALAAYTQGPHSVRTQGVFRQTAGYVADILALRRRM